MATLEEITVTVQAEIDAKKTANGGDGMFAQDSSGRREYTDAEYSQAVTDIADARFFEQENGYKTARQEAYGSIADQLDMQYHDLVDDTTTWKNHIAKVKSDNPKPS